MNCMEKTKRPSLGMPLSTTGKLGPSYRRTTTVVTCIVCMGFYVQADRVSLLHVFPLEELASLWALTVTVSQPCAHRLNIQFGQTGQLAARCVSVLSLEVFR